MKKIVQRPYSPAIAEQLAQASIPPVLARIFAARGITDPSQMDTDITRLLPFSAMKNATQMGSVLADAIAAGKKMLVVADYDADGATACAVAMRGLCVLGANVDFIVPNRFEYGYGLTPEIVRLAALRQPDILITVDNGIASVAGVAEAARLGMQVLVTDHHLPGDELPDALCIVNPNQPGCAFPSKHLAGVGVMFYVLMALRAEMRQRGVFTLGNEPNLGNLLDLVALGTVADVVKLDDNNRILVHQGLRRIRAGRSCAGIRALLRLARRPEAQVGSYELGFVVGPRLNAAGRLEDMSLGIRCLLTDDDELATSLASELDTLNQERRRIESEMQDDARGALAGLEVADGNSLVLFNEEWHQGVIGILASRLKEQYHRPVITFARAQQEGEIKGSGRSIPGLHLRDALDLIAKRHPELILKFGGHAMAAGLSILEQNLDTFRVAFETVASEMLSADDLVHRITTDGELETNAFTLPTACALQQQVWGQGFPEPLFEGVFDVQSQRVVGEKHLKLRLASSAGNVDAIRFFSTAPAADRIRAVYSLSVNEYNGNQTLQLILQHWGEA